MEIKKIKNKKIFDDTLEFKAFVECQKCERKFCDEPFFELQDTKSKYIIILCEGCGIKLKEWFDEK